MLEEQVLAEFWERLVAETQEKIAELPPDQFLLSHVALTEVILGYLEEAGLVSSHDLCAHEDEEGKSRCRIIAYSLPEESSRLELFTAVYSEGGASEPLPSKEIATLTGRAARYFAYAAKGDFSRFKDNLAADAAARYISQEIDRIEDVRIHLLTNSPVRDRSVGDIELLGRSVQSEVWDLERLHRAIGEEITRDRIEIDFKKVMGRPIACLEMKPPQPEYQTFMLIMPGDLIFKLYEQYGATLFEFNVRSFLQVKGAVNKGLRSTIEKEPERFLAYNNGLTATADEIEIGEFHGETVIHRLKGLQIVNGAQTTASIHRAAKVDKLDLSKIAVSMKLTLVEQGKLQEFVPLIARYANTQNPIQIADLSASDRFHQQFEALSESVWCPGEESRWFYERARGSYQVARARYGTTSAKRRDFDESHPKSQHFGKPDLAKYLMSWWGMPHVVSKGAQKNYSAFMFGLRERMGEGWEPDKKFFRDTIAKAVLFKAGQSVVRAAKLPSYGANVTTYLIAKLADDFGEEVSLETLWDNQEASPELKMVFATWAPLIHEALIETAARRNVTEWCKKDACWDALKALRLPMPSPAPPEFLPNNTTSNADVGDEQELESPVRICMKLDGSTWAHIVAWAAGTPNVDEYDRRVAHTISGYAMSGWLKEPSDKQAVRGLRVLQAAINAGAFTRTAAK